MSGVAVTHRRLPLCVFPSFVLTVQTNNPVINLDHDEWILVDGVTLQDSGIGESSSCMCMYNGQVAVYSIMKRVRAIHFSTP